MTWHIENGRLKTEQGFTLADMRYASATPQIKALIASVPELKDKADKLDKALQAMLEVPDVAGWPETEAATIALADYRRITTDYRPIIGG